jgi:periplasmic protein TonB
MRDRAVRRIKQVPQSVSQAAFARLCVAVVLSTTLHLYLIYGLALRPTHSPADRLSIINARLLPDAAVMKQHILEAPAAQRRRLPPAQPQVPSLPEPIETPVSAAQAPPAENRSPEPEVSTAGLPDPVHYAARDLDVYPQPLNRIEPVYPQTALAGEIGGSVTLLLLIDESGRVTDVSVVDASPQDVFEESALRALAATAYSPAQKNGRAVRSRILVKVDYDPIASVAEK